MVRVTLLAAELPKNNEPFHSNALLYVIVCALVKLIFIFYDGSLKSQLVAVCH